MSSYNIYIPKKYKLISFLFLALMVIFSLFFTQYLGSLTHADPYISIYGAAKRIIAFGLAIPMSIAFINVCPNKPWIARQGRLTMQYYIYRAFMIPPLMTIIDKLNISKSFQLSVILTFMITILLIITLYIPYSTIITNSLSFLYNLKRGRVKHTLFCYKIV